MRWARDEDGARSSEDERGALAGWRRSARGADDSVHARGEATVAWGRRRYWIDLVEKMRRGGDREDL